MLSRLDPWIKKEIDLAIHQHAVQDVIDDLIVAQLCVGVLRVLLLDSIEQLRNSVKQRLLEKVLIELKRPLELNFYG